MIAETRCGAHINAGALADGGHADDDVVTETHDRCACDSLDHAIAACQRRGARVADVPFAFGHKRKRGVIGGLGRHVELKRCNIRIGCVLKRRHCRAGIIACVRAAVSVPGHRSAEDWPYRW